MVIKQELLPLILYSKMSFHFIFFFIHLKTHQIIVCFLRCELARNHLHNDKPSNICTWCGGKSLVGVIETNLVMWIQISSQILNQRDDLSQVT